MTVTESELLRLLQSERRTIEAFRFGASLEVRAAKPLGQLIAEGSVARLQLAELHLSHAREATARHAYRAVVSRAYYSMYHSFRAVVFVVHDGDDFQTIDKLTRKLPQPYPVTTTGRMRLMGVRLVRNEADYEPYPLGDAAFRDAATLLIQHAEEALLASRQFINNFPPR